MLTSLARPRKTVEDFMRLPEGVLAELIDGEILVSPSLFSLHQETVVNLVGLLREFVKGNRLGKVLTAPMDVHLPSGDIVEPDVFFVATENLPIIQDWVRGVPDLVIEVLSQHGVARDRFVKRDLYARNGVREYWIADPATRSIEVFALRGRQYEPAGYFQEGAVLTSIVLSGLSLPVTEIYE